MGKCIAFLGQSPAQEMFAVVDGLAPATPRANTKMWNGSTWATVTGVGAIAFANYIGAELAAAGLDDEVKLYNGAVGGAALLQANAWTGNPTNYWVGASPAPYNALLAMVGTGGAIPDVVVHWGCWQDYLSTLSNLRGDCQTALGTLFGNLKAAWSKPDLLMNVWPSGRCNYGSPAPAMSPYVQAAQIAFATSTAGAYLGFSCYELPLRDGVHPSGTGYLVAGLRGAICVLAQLDVQGYQGIVMPRVLSASRSGSTFMLSTNVAGTLFPPNSWDSLSNISYLTGVQAWDDAWSVVPIAGVRTIGNQVRIDFAYPTGAHVTYQRGIDQNIDRPVFTEIKGRWFPLTPIADEQQFHT